MEDSPRSIAVDFDGTIVEHDFPGIGKLKPGAKEALAQLREKYRVVIFSCRNNPTLNSSDFFLREMEKFLDRYNVPYDEIDDGSNGKPVAVAYVDDRGLEFKDNWPEIAAKLMNRHYGR